MSDHFAPPPVADTDYRQKTPLCPSRDEDGTRCSLYRDHYGDCKDKDRRKQWPRP